MRISKDDIKIITGRTVSDALTASLRDAMKTYDIDTPLRVAHFLAQTAHESGGFYYREEIASGEEYEGRADLGNTSPGDGKKFKGRGDIQLTGRANYEAYSKAKGVDFVLNPDLVATDEYVHDVAAWFWTRKKLNRYADADDVVSITKRINGGLNGIVERTRMSVRAKALFKGRESRPSPIIEDVAPIIPTAPADLKDNPPLVPKEEAVFLFKSKPLWTSKRVWGIIITILGVFGPKVEFLHIALGQYDAIVAGIGVLVNLYGTVVAKHKLELWPSKK